jgi:hypothetical protein
LPEATTAVEIIGAVFHQVVEQQPDAALWSVAVVHHDERTIGAFMALTPVMPPPSRGACRSASAWHFFIKAEVQAGVHDGSLARQAFAVAQDRVRAARAFTTDGALS